MKTQTRRPAMTNADALMQESPSTGDGDALPIEAVLDEVRRFGSHALEPAVARHEHRLGPERLTALRTTSSEFGLLCPSADEASGLGLWEAVERNDGRRLSTAALRMLAQVNMGFAWQLHQFALSGHFERHVGFASTALNLVALQGRYGLARHALARYLTATAGPDDLIMLRDYFDTTTAPGVLLHAAEDWAGVWLPELDSASVLQWGLWPRERLVVETHRHSHGLDELCSFVVCRRGEAQAAHRTQLDIATSRRLLTTLLTLNAMGQLATGLGGLDHAHRLAADYAATRRQGGGVIARHAAVQLLLSRARQIQQLTSHSLEACCACAPDSAQTLAMLYQTRATLQPELCRATSDALQVFGGMGYMRDTGLEKILRDQNTLRVIHGTPIELQLAATALEEDTP